MSDLTSWVTRGIDCNGTDCEAEVTGPKVSTLDDTYTRKAVAAGWTVWVGRSRRHYCPTCAPKPGHKMREITAIYRSLLGTPVAPSTSQQGDDQ